MRAVRATRSVFLASNQRESHESKCKGYVPTIELLPLNPKIDLEVLRLKDQPRTRESFKETKSSLPRIRIFFQFMDIPPDTILDTEREANMYTLLGTGNEGDSEELTPPLSKQSHGAN